jgi:RHS repeat-associated protein
MLINPNGVFQRRSYDLNGRVQHVDDFDGNIIDLEYDQIDNLIRYRDKQKDIKYTYQGLWKLSSRSEAGSTIYFNYDTEEQLYKVVNEHGFSYSYEFDPAGNVVEEIGFDKITRKYIRNAAGWVTSVGRPAGKFTTYEYDPCGRILGVRYSDGGSEVYSYSKDGEITTAENETAIVKIERDLMGSVIKENLNNEWISSEYDELGNRLSITSSLGANINNQYTVMGDILAVNSKGWFLNLEYDKLCLETKRVVPGGVHSEWTRDGIGRPISQNITQLEGKLLHKKRQYAWEVNGRLKQIKEQKGTSKFEYDQRSNLAKTIFSDGQEELRNPDLVGNLYRSDFRKDRVYSTGGRLEKDGKWQYQYDEEGNLIERKAIQGETWKYIWNDAGLLAKVVKPDDTVIEFGYDAFRRRVFKKFKNTITRFFWDGNVPLHEWKEHAITGQKLSDIHIGDNGIVTWLFDEEGFSPAGKLKGEKQYSIITDHLGTPIQVFKDDGSLIWEGELDSSGKLRMEKGESGTCPFRFQGQYEDSETGLVYNRFRYYSASEGVYLSQDPIGLEGGLVLYGHVHDTNVFIDVFGLNSSALNRDLDGEPHDQKQAHHVVPVAVWNKNEPFLNEVGLKGQRDKASNGLLMHDNAANGKKDGRAFYHNGSHDKYSRKVDNELQKIKARYKKHKDKNKAKGEIEALQKRLKRNLNRKTKAGCKRLS